VLARVKIGIDVCLGKPRIDLTARNFFTVQERRIVEQVVAIEVGFWVDDALQYQKLYLVEFIQPNLPWR